MGKVVRQVKNQDELQLALDWAVKEDWNPGRFDGAPYYAASHTGYFVLEEDENIIGTLAAIRYSDEYGFIGIFIVAPEYRRQGNGNLLFNAGINALSNCALVGLNAVPPQVSYYKGFGFSEAWQNLRCSIESPLQGSHIDDMRLIDENLDKLIAYDANIFGTMRADFLKTLLAAKNTTCLVSFDTQGNIAGYGVIRSCQQGFRIGPLYANDFNAAKSLFEGLLSCVLGEKIILDIPEVNQYSKNFMEFFHLTREENADTFAMYKQSSAMTMMTQLEKRYALGSLEIGDGLPSQVGYEVMQQQSTLRSKK